MRHPLLGSRTPGTRPARAFAGTCAVGCVAVALAIVSHDGDAPPSPSREHGGAARLQPVLTPEQRALAALYGPRGPFPGPNGSVAATRIVKLSRVRIRVPTYVSLGPRSRYVEVEGATTAAVRRLSIRLTQRGKLIAHKRVRSTGAASIDSRLRLRRAPRTGRAKITIAVVAGGRRGGRRPRQATILLYVLRVSS